MSDKRSVSTDALETLGTHPIPDDSGRDAIHLAVEPVIASERLLAGQDVYLLPDGRAARGKENAVGIVDPFLKESVKEGQKFWLVVYPRKITSLRHVWSHPSFDDPVQPVFSEADRLHSRHVAEKLTRSSEAWLRNFCASSDCPDYDTVIQAAKKNHDDEYLHFDGQDAHGSIPDEFWDHLENLTGKRFLGRATYFSCSC